MGKQQYEHLCIACSQRQCRGDRSKAAWFYPDETSRCGGEGAVAECQRLAFAGSFREWETGRRENRVCADVCDHCVDRVADRVYQFYESGDGAERQAGQGGWGTKGVRGREK